MLCLYEEHADALSNACGSANFRDLYDCSALIQTATTPPRLLQSDQTAAAWTASTDFTASTIFCSLGRTKLSIGSL